MFVYEKIDEFEVDGRARSNLLSWAVYLHSFMPTKTEKAARVVRANFVIAAIPEIVDVLECWYDKCPVDGLLPAVCNALVAMYNSHIKCLKNSSRTKVEIAEELMRPLPITFFYYIDKANIKGDLERNAAIEAMKILSDLYEDCDDDFDMSEYKPYDEEDHHGEKLVSYITHKILHRLYNW